MLNISENDIRNIKELLVCLSVAEIAEKWEMSVMQFRHSLRSKGVSVNQVRAEYRVKYVKDHIEQTTTAIAKQLNCSHAIVRAIKVELLSD